MSGTDQIVLNTRERATSNDVNDLQSLKDRTFLDSLLHQFALRTYASGVVPTETGQPVVLGGLEVLPSGTGLSIEAGVLCQESATLTPVPGALDSQYRWAALRAPLVVANPAPGGNTWYLLEVQMDDIVASSLLKDIWDVGLGAFVPTTVDKRTERTLTAQLVAGSITDLPLPSGGDWVAIAGVFVVAGGGAIPAANIMDMRPLADDLGPAVRPAIGSGLRCSSIDTIGAANGIKTVVVSAEAWVQGRRLWLDTDKTGVGLVAAVSTFGEVGTNPQVGSALGYLYACPLQDAGTRALFVRNAYAHVPIARMNGNCILVWSTNAPDSDGNLNSTALAMPAPFNNYTCPIGGAVCIGAIQMTTAAVIAPTGSRGDNFQALQTNLALPVGMLDAITPTGGGAADAIALANVPVCARTVEILVTWRRDAVGTADAAMDIQPTGGGVHLCPVQRRFDPLPLAHCFHQS